MLGDNLKLVADDGDIFLLTEQLQPPFMIIPLHTGISHQVKQVKFNSLNVIVCHTAADILQHHLMSLTRQAIDQVRDNLRLGSLLTNSLDRLHIELIRMGTIDEVRSLLIGSLKPQFHGHMHTLGQVSQVGDGLIRQTVRPSSDIESNDTWLINGLLIALTNHFKLLMGIGEVLEIDQILANIRPLAVHKVNFLVKLLADGRIWCHNSITRARNGTKSAASMRYRTIPIGTVKARINRHLKSLFSKKFAIIIIQRIVRFHTFHSTTKKSIETKIPSFTRKEGNHRSHK